MNKKKSLRELICEFRLKIANDFKIERTPTQIFQYFRGTLNDENKVGVRSRVCEVINICLRDTVCLNKIVSDIAFLGKEQEDLDHTFKFKK